MEIKITLEVGGIYREYKLDECEVEKLDLNAQLADMIDTIENVEADYNSRPF
jgi:hypothetical protein